MGDTVRESIKGVKILDDDDFPADRFVRVVGGGENDLDLPADCGESTGDKRPAIGGRR